MAWEENSRICLHMQLIAILSRIGVCTDVIRFYVFIVWHTGIHFCSSRGMVLAVPVLRDLSVSSFSIGENEPFLGGFTPPATWRTTAVFSMVLDLFFPKHCVHKDTARYVSSYSWKNKRIVLLSRAILQIIILICLNSSNTCQLFIFSDWLSS